MIDHELACITRMIQTGSVRAHEHALKEEHFAPQNFELIERLLQYERTTGKCMDDKTFVGECPDFVWTPTEYQVEFYLEELESQWVIKKATALRDDVFSVIEDDPRKAIAHLSTEAATLYNQIEVRKHGADFIAETTIALQRRLETTTAFQGLVGATTGFKLLDEVTHGTQPGEIEYYVARPGMGKTFTLLYSVYRAWKDQGKRVAIVSPEMTREEMGLRLVAFHFHISQMKMQSGRMTAEEIDEFRAMSADWRADFSRDMSFYGTIERGRRFTTGDIRQIAESHDLIAIDGLMFIEPAQKTKDLRMRLIAVNEELKAIATEQNVALRIAHQASRSPEKRARKTGKSTPKDDSAMLVNQLPDLDELAESGSTEQFANRVITMKYDDIAKRMFYAVRKNRNGPSNRIFSVYFDIDRGVVGDELLIDSDGKEITREPVQQQFLDDDGSEHF